MSEIKVEIRNIDKLEVKGKVVEEKMEGEVIDKKVVTTVKFDYEGSPGDVNKVLLALANDHKVTAAFYSPQGILDLEEEKTKPEPVAAS